MAGLDPAIHVFDFVLDKDVDARDERGQDESNIASVGMILFASATAIGPIPLSGTAVSR
jgi:hypothetical protein